MGRRGSSRCCCVNCVEFEDLFDNSSIDSSWTQDQGSWSETIDDWIETSSSGAALRQTTTRVATAPEVRFTATNSGDVVRLLMKSASGAFGSPASNDATNYLDFTFGTGLLQIYNSIDILVAEANVTLTPGTWYSVANYFNTTLATPYLRAVLIDGVPIVTYVPSNGSSGVPMNLGTAALTGTAKFNLFRTNHNSLSLAGCLNVGPLCGWPASLDLIDELTLTVANPELGTCPACSGIAGTFLLTRSGGNCIYSIELPIPVVCGGDTYTHIRARINIEFNASFGRWLVIVRIELLSAGVWIIISDYGIAPDELGLTSLAWNGGGAIRPCADTSTKPEFTLSI